MTRSIVVLLPPLVAAFMPLAAAACSSNHSASSAPAENDAGAVDAAVEPEAAVGDGAPTACSPTDPRNPPITLTVQPDEGEGPIVNVLTPAQKNIRVMIFDIGTSTILSTLVQKAQSGVEVSAILDQTQQSFDQDAYNQLVAAGAKVQWSNPKFTYTHAKTIVVDDSTSVISTGNFDGDMISEERDYVMVDSDPQDVAQLASIFDNDWANTTPDLSCTRLVVSPVNSQDRILAVINAATKTLDVESMEFGDSAVQAAVIAKQKAGVATRVLLSDPSFDSSITYAVSDVEAQGLTPRRLVTPQLHVKSIIVDGTMAYAGSENMSSTSLTQNREVGLVITEAPALATMQSTFEADWAASLPYGSDAGSEGDGASTAAAGQ